MQFLFGWLRGAMLLALASLILSTLAVVGLNSPSQAADKPTMKILVMGDSYSAGNGAGSQYGPAGCWRSKKNYAELFAEDLRQSADQPVDVVNAACSGAVTQDVFEEKDGRPPEIKFVEPGVDLVFLTIGGNDAFFAKIVKFCLVAVTRDGATCNTNLDRAERLLAQSDPNDPTSSTIGHQVDKVLRKVNESAASRAKIVLLGYPKLEGEDCQGDHGCYTLRSGRGANAPIIEVGRRLFEINQKADEMQSAIVENLNKKVDNSYPGDPFAFVETQSLFNGPPYHGLYAKKDNPDRWMVQPRQDAGELTFSTYYHPNPDGWRAEADLLWRSVTKVPRSVMPVISTTTMPTAKVGESYSKTLRTSDNRNGTWGIRSNGALPPGLNLNSGNGVISGAPTAAGTYRFVSTFTDSTGRQASRALILNVSIQLAGKIAHLSDGRSWYVDKRDGKHRIPDGGTFECLAAQGIQVVETDASVVGALAPYESAECVRANRGDIIRHADGDAHLLNDDWTRSSIPNGNMYECLRLNGHAVVNNVPRYYILDHAKAADANFSCYDSSGVNGKAVRASDGSSWYIDKRGSKHSIPDGGTYECIAAQAGAWNYVVPRAWLTQTKYEDAKCVRAAPGNIIKTADGDSYLVNSGWTRSWIPSANAFQCVRAEGGRTVVDGVPRYYIDDLTKAGDISFPGDVCILRKSNGTAYFLNGQTKREWIPDSPTWDCEVGRGIRVVNANDAVVDGLAETGWHYCLNKANLRGKMLRHTDGDVHYIHPDDTSTWIPDQFTYGCRQRAGVQQVETRWREYVTAFRETGWDYCFNLDTFRNQYIAHPDGDKHYVTANGVRHYAQSASVVNCLNARNGTPATVRWREYINAIPEGEWAICGDTLYRNQKLDRGQWLNSNGYSFVMQDDGNAVIYNRSGRPIWATGTDGSAHHIQLHDAGYNYCLARVNNNNSWSWQVGCGRNADRLVMQGDGNLVLYAGNTAVWASNTVGR